MQNKIKLNPLGITALSLLTGYTTAVSATASPILIHQSPLFLTTSEKANVLVILDNSNSMDEAANGSAVGSDDPNSKSEIARTAVNNLVSSYTGKINMGLMAYQQAGISIQNLDNSPYDISYDPANYNPSFTGARDSITKRYRAEKADDPGNYVYYNIALPFYHSGGSLGNTQYCYSTTANAFNNGETPPTYDSSGNVIAFNGPWDTYQCYGHKGGTSDGLSAGAGYTSYMGSGGFYPTDSDLAQGISDFGSRMSSEQIGVAWFSNQSPGRGFLHIPLSDLDTVQANKLYTKLGVSQFSTNQPTNDSFPLQNAGLTPLEGTLMTARTYFSGGTLTASEGGPAPALPQSCGHDFIALLTDGLPSTDASGQAISSIPTALSDVAAVAASLHTDGIETYMIGFALPTGTNPTSLDIKYS